METPVYKQIIKKILKTREYCKYKNKLYWNTRSGYERVSPITRETKKKFYIENQAIEKTDVFDLDDYTDFNQWDQQTIDYFVGKGWIPKPRHAENILDEWSGRV